MTRPCSKSRCPSPSRRARASPSRLPGLPNCPASSPAPAFRTISSWSGSGSRNRACTRQGRAARAEGGWNCHQFHVNTEFFADYGTWDVTLTVPSDFEIAATGRLRHEHTQPDGATAYNFYQEDVHEFAWTAQPRSQVLKIERAFKADEQVSPAEIDEWSRKTGTPPEQVKLQDVSHAVHPARAPRPDRPPFPRRVRGHQVVRADVRQVSVRRR